MARLEFLQHVCKYLHALCLRLVLECQLWAMLISCGIWNLQDGRAVLSRFDFPEWELTSPRRVSFIHVCCMQFEDLVARRDCGSQDCVVWRGMGTVCKQLSIAKRIRWNWVLLPEGALLSRRTYSWSLCRCCCRCAHDECMQCFGTFLHAFLRDSCKVLDQQFHC